MRELICDVDGTALAFVPHALNILGLTHIPPNTIRTKLREALSTKDQERLDELLRGPEFWLTLPLIDGVLEAKEKLHHRGVRIHWCSSPYDDCPLWHWARKEVLWKKLNSPLSDLTAAKEKWRIDGDYFLDDDVDNCVEWAQARGGKAFVYDQPYNRDFSGLPRVSWSTILTYIA